MTSTTSWKSPLPNQEMVETHIFTWRLRPHDTHAPLTGPNGVTARNSKSTSLAGVSRHATPSIATNASSSLSSSILPTIHSHLPSLQQVQQEKFLRYQEFELEAGHSLGLPSTWSLFLVSCGSPSAVTAQRSNSNITAVAGASGSNAPTTSSSPPSGNSDFIGLFLREVIKPTKPHSGYASGSKGDEIVARYKIEIMDTEGDGLYTNEFESTAKDTLEPGFWDWKKIAPLSKFYSARGKGKDEAGNSANEVLLLLRVSFTMVSRRKGIGKKKAVEVDGNLNSVAEVSTRQAANAFFNFVTSAKSLQPDVIIEIPNRRKFSVHKKILSDRSPHFMKLLGPDTNERRGKLVRVEDITGNAMELVLKHIYTGQLEEEWTTVPATIAELIFASEKYGLPALKEFCSTHLVKAATKNNCYKLMEVAQTHHLEQAAEDLMSYASEGIATTPAQSRKTSKESVEKLEPDT